MERFHAFLEKEKEYFRVVLNMGPEYDGPWRQEKLKKLFSDIHAGQNLIYQFFKNRPADAKEEEWKELFLRMLPESIHYDGEHCITTKTNVLFDFPEFDRDNKITMTTRWLDMSK